MFDVEALTKAHPSVQDVLNRWVQDADWAGVDLRAIRFDPWDAAQGFIYRIQLESDGNVILTEKGELVAGWTPVTWPTPLPPVLLAYCVPVSG